MSVRSPRGLAHLDSGRLGRGFGVPGLSSGSGVRRRPFHRQACSTESTHASSVSKYPAQPAEGRRRIKRQDLGKRLIAKVGAEFALRELFGPVASAASSSTSPTMA